MSRWVPRPRPTAPTGPTTALSPQALVEAFDSLGPITAKTWHTDFDRMLERLTGESRETLQARRVAGTCHPVESALTHLASARERLRTMGDCTKGSPPMSVDARAGRLAAYLDRLAAS